MPRPLFRSRVLGEGWECLLPFHRRFVAEPHATMLFFLVAVCVLLDPLQQHGTYFLCLCATSARHTRNVPGIFVSLSKLINCSLCTLDFGAAYRRVGRQIDCVCVPK
jgi:hypothetical protein